MPRLLFALSLLFVAQLAVAATITVTSTGDVVSEADQVCNLREAIMSANSNTSVGSCTAGASGVTDTITFAISGTIAPAQSLPTITGPVAIQATLGSVLLSGAATQPSSAGLWFAPGSDGSSVRGLVIASFPGPAVIIESSNNIIAGNRLGTDASGTSAAPNCTDGFLGAVTVRASGTSPQAIAGNLIGGTTDVDRNIISGNPCTAVYLDASAAGVDTTSIKGNYIGTDVSGDSPLFNGEIGVQIIKATNTTLGGTEGVTVAQCTGACNVIAGGYPVTANPTHVSVLQTPSGTTRIAGNFIGLNRGGSTSFNSPGRGSGVVVEKQTGAVLVGGATAQHRNVISGVGTGVRIGSGSGLITPCPVTIQSNYIGLSSAGTSAIPNFSYAVYVASTCAGVQIGGSAVGSGNYFGGNGQSAIFLDGGSGSVIQGNFIGVGADGRTAVPNGQGIVISANASDNIVGAAVSGGPGGNVIANNTNSSGTYAGINVTYGKRNRISTNSIYSNIAGNPSRGIELDVVGPTGIDHCDVDDNGKANELQNYPTITSASATPSQLTIIGSLDSEPNATYTIEFYANPPGTPTPYQARTYVGSTDVQTDGNCSAAFQVVLPVPVASGGTLTALAIASDQNTSELSDPVTITGTSGVKSDFNLDGKTDILLRNYTTGQTAVWVMNGTSVSSIIDLPGLTNVNFRIEGTADFNGDGSSDILWRNYVTGQNALWLMQGASVSSVVDLPSLANIDFHFEGTGDFNDDGRPDIIIRNYFTGNNALWLMNATQLMSVVDLPPLTNTNYKIESSGDFSGDGKPDIVLRNYVTGQTALWIMNGTSLASIVDLPALANTSYRIDGVGDFNQDGKPDIVWRNGSTGQNALWLMNGTSLSSIVDLPLLSNMAYEINGPR
jgi:hypothetical protein